MSLRKWTSSSNYIDIETGEKIEKQIAKKYYRIIKTNKNVKDISEQSGHIEYIIECRRKEQLELFD